MKVASVVKPISVITLTAAAALLTGCADKNVMDTVRVRLSNDTIAQVPEKIVTKVEHSEKVIERSQQKPVDERQVQQPMSKRYAGTPAKPAEEVAYNTISEQTRINTETKYTEGGALVVALKSDFGITEQTETIVFKHGVGENEVYKYEALQIVTGPSPLMAALVPLNILADTFAKGAAGYADIRNASSYADEVGFYGEYVRKWEPEKTIISNNSASNAYSEGAQTWLNNVIKNDVNSVNVNKNDVNSVNVNKNDIKSINVNENVNKNDNKNINVNENDNKNINVNENDNKNMNNVEVDSGKDNGHGGGCGKERCALNDQPMRPVAVVGKDGSIIAVRTVLNAALTA